jgi:hypothetical protein
MTSGVLMYAHNNSEIDYFKIACANALMVKRNLGKNTTLITDSGTYSWGKKNLGGKLINECFEHIIEIDRNYSFENPRGFQDTSHTTKTLQFYNCHHWKAYELSPYDETLFIDSDYLVMSDALNKCWDSVYDVMINKKIYSPYETIKIKYLDDLGIELYWATAIFFRKSPLAETLFLLVKHIEENYQYYKDLYGFRQGMYRNDNAFSIAIHTLNGFNSVNNIVSELPIPGLLMSWDVNDINQIHGINDISIFSEKENEKGNYLLSRFKNTDIHIMNKWAINRHSDTLISLYRKA